MLSAIAGQLPFEASRLSMTYSCSDWVFMMADSTPYLGRMQSGLGRDECLSLLRMKQTRNSRSKRPPSTASRHLRENILGLLAYNYPTLSAYARNTKLAELSRLSRSQIERMVVDPDDLSTKIQYVESRIDTVEMVALALNVTTADLLTPGFAIKRKNV